MTVGIETARVAKFWIQSLNRRPLIGGDLKTSITELYYSSNQSKMQYSSIICHLLVQLKLRDNGNYLGYSKFSCIQ